MLAVVASLFLSFPSYDYLNSASADESWEPVLRQFSDPSTNMTDYYGSESHASKKTFRLTVPILAHLLGFKTIGAVCLQGLAGVLLLFFAVSLFFRITRDRPSAFFLTLAISFSYPGTASFVELRGIFDGVALCAMLGSMWARHPVGIAGAVFFASWTDERGLIASSLVWIYHALRRTGAQSRSQFSIDLWEQRAVAVVIAWILYFISRIGMVSIYELETATGGIGLGVFFDQINQIPMGLWTGLEGGWLVVLLAGSVLWATCSWRALACLAAATVVIAGVALSVVDITRSMAYLLPAVFIGTRVLAEVDSGPTLRSYSVLACAISLFWAAYYAGGVSTIWWNYPLPIQALRWLVT